MTREQCAVAVPILNSYAHQYLGLDRRRLLVAGGGKGGKWWLIVALPAGPEKAADLDAAKAMIDAFAASQ